MSAPLEDYELSGLLDGELTPARAAEVRLLIRSDPGVGEQYRLLSVAHQVWRDAARSSRFDPQVQLDLPGALSSAHPGIVRVLVPLLISLVAGRMLLHLSPWGLMTDLLLQLAFLVVTLGIVLWISATWAETVPAGVRRLGSPV